LSTAPTREGFAAIRANSYLNLTKHHLDAWDQTGEKAKAVKARYVGLCRGCGAYTQPRNGKGDAYRYCKRCRPGAIQRKWTRELVLAAMREWRERYGRLPSSYDWSCFHAKKRGLRERRRSAGRDLAGGPRGCTGGGERSRLLHPIIGARSSTRAREGNFDGCPSEA
jgi:hypothetical protein